VTLTFGAETGLRSVGADGGAVDLQRGAGGGQYLPYSHEDAGQFARRCGA
jgi:hypothetical protein